MKAKVLILAGTLATALTGLAFAAEPPASRASACFFTTAWQGWKAPNDKTLYLRVNMHDVYRVDLQAGSPFLTGPDPHIISLAHGTDTICSPLDLDLQVSDGVGGPVEPVIAKSLVKLTPDQVAAIPKKDLP